jgi:hypothetical protein
VVERSERYASVAKPEEPKDSKRRAWAALVRRRFVLRSYHPIVFCRPSQDGEGVFVNKHHFYTKIIVNTRRKCPNNIYTTIYSFISFMYFFVNKTFSIQFIESLINIFKSSISCSSHFRI